MLLYVLCLLFDKGDVGYEEERSLCVVLEAADDLVRVLFNQHDGNECFACPCS